MALGKIATWVEESYRTFQEEVAGALDGKEFQLLEPGTADNTVKLNATAGHAFGIMFEKLQPGTGKKDDISVRLLNGEGTVKMIQNGAIAYGARVMEDSTALTKVKQQTATTGTYRTLGFKVGAGAGAAGDVIEVFPMLETIVVP